MFAEYGVDFEPERSQIGALDRAILVGGGDTCAFEFEWGAEYFVLFEAKLDDDGTTPAEAFLRCRPATL